MWILIKKVNFENPSVTQSIQPMILKDLTDHSIQPNQTFSSITGVSSRGHIQTVKFNTQFLKSIRCQNRFTTWMMLTEHFKWQRKF